MTTMMTAAASLCYEIQSWKYSVIIVSSDELFAATIAGNVSRKVLLTRFVIQ
jgi:hypothetical protein